METNAVEKPKRLPKPKKLTPAEQVAKEFTFCAARKGCPPDQILNLINARVWLQPKQLEFAALARQCDKPDGPKMILSGGGRGSAKSHAILAQIFCDDCQRVPGLKCLFIRKVGQANKEQISDFVTKLLPNLPHKYREATPSKVEFNNGSFVILGNFKDEKDIDKYLGLEYDLIYIMESNQLTQSKKINVLSCLRTNKTNWRPRCYQDTNPGGIDHVANKMLFVEPWKIEMAGGKKQAETRYLHSTVDDNKFIDKGYKEYLEKLVGWQREAWLNGSWEFMAGAFFSNFYPDVHVYPNAQTDINLRSIVRWFAGLDYGFSHPTAFVLACEDEGGNIFVPAIYYAANAIIEEHAAEIRDVCSLFNLDVSELEFIAAGKDCFRVDKDGSTVATEYQERGILLTAVHIDRINAWSQVAEVFGDVQHQIRPRCFIQKNCTELIFQIQAAQSDPKKPNDILKMNADPETQEGGDDVLEACFVAGTMITVPGGELPIENIKVGQMVLTGSGWRPVIESGMTNKSASVLEVQLSTGRNLIGTGGHRVWTQNGWRRLDSLRNNDIVSVCNQNLKPLCSTEENSAAIQNRSGQPTGGITSQAESGGLAKAFRFIKKSGSRFMEKFRRDTTFITKTETPLTTESKIWNWFLLKNTRQDTPEKSRKKCEDTLPQSVPKPSIGTTQKRQARLQKETGRHLLENALLSVNMNVGSAGKNSNQGRHKEPNSATSTAKWPRLGQAEGFWKKESALSVEMRSRFPSSQKPKLAPASVEQVFAVGQRPVFNLTVDGCPEYFAKGVLVHNCRNAIVMAYSSLLKFATPLRMGNFQPMNQPAENGPEYVDVEEVIRLAEKNEEDRRAGRGESFSVASGSLWG